MAKPISLRLHGIIDYLTVPLLLLAGPFLGFRDLAGQITSTLAGAVLVYAAGTAYPLGLVKLVPLAGHRAIDAILGIFMIAAPWLFGFVEVAPARNFFVAFGIFSLIVVVLTDWSEAPSRHVQRS